MVAVDEVAVACLGVAGVACAARTGEVVAAGAAGVAGLCLVPMTPPLVLSRLLWSVVVVPPLRAALLAWLAVWLWLLL